MLPESIVRGRNILDAAAGAAVAEPAHAAPDARRAFEKIQAEFPINRSKVYLNSASIGPLADRVRKAVEGFNTDVAENGRLNYPQWCAFADRVAKGNAARLLGCQASELAFVKNTTEGLVLVANGLRWRAGDNVIVADIEYPSNVYCWMNLKDRGVELRWVKTRAGRILVDDLARAMDARTRLVSLSGVQFSNGFRLDLERTGELCRSRGVLFNLDMIQYLGALKLDLARCPIDFLSAGGHKWLLGPIGTGLFYCRQEALEHLHPHSVGYHSVDKSEDHLDYDLTFRPGSGRFEEALVNFPGIYGLDAAIGMHLELGAEQVERHILELNALATERLEARGYRIISPKEPGERSGILSFTHATLPQEEIVARLRSAGVHIAIRGQGMRISPSIFNTPDHIAALMEALP